MAGHSQEDTHFTLRSEDGSRLVSFPDPPSEKSRKGLVTRMAMRCPRGLYTRANQMADIIYVTFNRGCANSSVYGDRHGVQLTRFPEAE